MAKKVLIGVVGLVVLLAVVGLVLPSSAHVERSTTIDAPAAAVFPWVNDLEKLSSWSPWMDRDPNMKRQISEPSAGVGATLSWQSDQDDVGSGSQKIVESVEARRVVTKLDFGDQGDATAYFDLSPSGAGTKVTWGFDTDFGTNLIGRYFGLMFDGMIGPDYEKGLANLKRTVESQPAPVPEAPVAQAAADAQGAGAAADAQAEPTAEEVTADATGSEEPKAPATAP